MQPFKAVVKAGFTVAVRVDDLLCAVFLRHGGKAAGLFQDVRGRIVEEDDEAAVAVAAGGLKGEAQALQLPRDELFGAGGLALVPADDAPAPVQVEGPLEGEPLGAHQGGIAVGAVVVLQEEEPAGIAPVQRCGLLRIPEHVVVAAQQDFAPRQRGDEIQVRAGLLRVFAPAVVACQHEGVLRPHQRAAVCKEALLVPAPDGVRQLAGGFQFAGEMEVQIPDGVEAHGASPVLFVSMNTGLIIALPATFGKTQSARG